MNLFNLFGRLTLDNTEYKKNIDEAKSKNDELAENTKSTNAKSVLTWGAVAGAILLVVNHLKNLLLETANYADQIGDLAQKWGFTTKEIQEFDYWATMNGTTLESLLTGMRGLVNQADAGADAFNKLGVSVRNADGTLKDQKSLFLETIDALKKVDNQTERNALQFEIFGRAGIELGQIINKSAEELNALSNEADNLGIIISDETIEQAGAFNDELDKIKKQWQSLLASLFAGDSDLDNKIDAFIETISGKLEEWLPKIVSFGVRLIEALIKGVLVALPELVNALVEALTNIDWFGLGLDIIKAIINGMWQGFLNSPFMKLIGYGWLWGGEEPSANVSTTDNQVSVITNSRRLERTEKVEETLDISLKVESDGTTAGKENLDIVSDLVVDKINKILGGEV